MAKEHFRSLRIAQEMKKEIAIILQRRIKDPRIDTVSTVISDVTVSSDLSYAKVFVILLNSKNKMTIKSNIKALQHASGFIRFLLSETTYLRVVPKLDFFYDNSLMEGIRISNLIDSTMKYKTYYVNSNQ